MPTSIRQGFGRRHLPVIEDRGATSVASHVLATNVALGPQHTISGASAGWVLRALSATTARFQQLDYSDLSGTPASLPPSGPAGGDLTGTYPNPTVADADLIAIRDLVATAGMLSRTGAGAFAARTLTQPAAGLTITNPTGAAGDPTFALANDLLALEGLATTGISVRTAVDTWATRSLVQPGAGITIADADGVAGNPTFALANDLAALEALGSTGFATRTGADTWAQRSLTQPAAGITITNPAGVAGNPTFALANDLAALEGLASTGFGVRTGSDTWAQRSLTQPAAGITIANNDGVSGNPTFALANDLAALEGLASTGIAVRTAADTWAQRTIVAGSSAVTVTNGSGVAGNPSIDLSLGNINHNALLNLAVGDVHTQYLLLAGRAGGQTATGGTASGNNLTFRSNTSNDGEIRLGDSITTSDGVVIHGTGKDITIGGVAFHSHLSVWDQASVGDAVFLGRHHTNTAATGPSMGLSRARGTAALPSAVSDNDTIGRILGLGYDGTDYERVAEILFEMDETTPGIAAMGGAIILSTTPTGSTTLSERFRVSANAELFHTVTGATIAAASNYSGLWLMEGTVNVPLALSVSAIGVRGTLNSTAAAFLGLPAIGLLDDGHIHTANAGLVQIPTDVSLYLHPTIRNTTATNWASGAGSPGFGATGVLFQPVLSRTSTGTMAGGQLQAVTINSITVPASVTVDRLAGLVMASASVSGTLTEIVGVDLAAFAAGTTRLSLRSAGAAVEMRHAGPGVFGANAAPSGGSVALEVQSTTQAMLLPRMTTAQRNAMTPINGMIIYNTTTAVIEGYEAGAWVNL